MCRVSWQGQRTLSCFCSKDLHQEVVAPTGDLALAFDAGVHLIRYYGWYSNKARGMRRKAAEAAAAAAQSAASASEAAEQAPARRCSQTWAMLIKRVYEVDPLACPRCGGQMKVVAFIEPPQGAVIEKILRHCGLWHPSAPRAPPPGDHLVYVPENDWDGQRRRG